MIVFICILSLVLVFPVFFKLKLIIKDTGGNGIYFRLSLLGFTLYRAVFKINIKNFISPEIYETRKGKTRLVFSFKNLRSSKKKKKHSKEKNVFKRTFLRVFIVDRLYLRLEIGTGDAAASTLICGILQSVFDIGARYLNKRLVSGTIDIMPQFEKTGINFFIDCIINVRMADIIREVLFKKGGGKNAPNRKHIKGNNVRA